MDRPRYKYPFFYRARMRHTSTTAALGPVRVLLASVTCALAFSGCQTTQPEAPVVSLTAVVAEAPIVVEAPIVAEANHEADRLPAVQSVVVAAEVSLVNESRGAGVEALPVAELQDLAPANTSPSGSLLLEEGFESGQFDYKVSGNKPELVEVLDARAGNFVMQSRISSGQAGQFRTEASLNQRGLIFKPGREYWVGLSMKLGEDFAEGDFNDQGMLMQWRYFDWKHPKALGRPQPLQLRYDGHGLVLVDNEVFDLEGTASRTMARVPVEVGKWMDWVFQYKIDDVDGIIRIWCNGELVVDWVGDNHQVAKYEGAFLNFGLYSAQFMSGKSPSEQWRIRMPEGFSRTVYHDELRIAGADGSYELVAPRGR